MPEDNLSPNQILEKVTRLEVLRDESIRVIDELCLARELPHKPLEKHLEEIVELGAAVREGVSNLASSADKRLPEWNSQSDLKVWLEEAKVAIQLGQAQVEKARRVLDALIQELNQGEVQAKLNIQTRRGESLRLETLEAVRQAREMDSPPELPTDEESQSWLRWAWDLPENELESLLEDLPESLESLGDFLISVSPDHWKSHLDSGADPGEKEPVPEEPTPPPPLPDPPEPLSEELESYSAFASHYWVTPKGKCEPGPWRTEEFQQQLQSEIRNRFEMLGSSTLTGRTSPLSEVVGNRQPAGRTGRSSTRTRTQTKRAQQNQSTLSWDHFPALWVNVKAAVELGLSPQLCIHDLEAFADLWASPTSANVGQDSGRVDRLRSALENDTVQNAPLFRLPLVLEALCVSEDCLSEDEVNQLLKKVKFRNKALSTVVQSLLQMGARQRSPLQEARQHLRAAGTLSLEDIEKQLEEARKQFSQTFADQMEFFANPEGKPYQRVWHSLSEKVREKVEKLFPLDQGGTDPSSEEEILQTEGDLGTLEQDCKGIYGRQTAQNKRDMQSAIQKISKEGMQVTAKQKALLAALAKDGHPVDEHFPLDSLKVLVDRSSLGNEEEIYRCVIKRAVQDEAPVDGDPLGLTFQALFSHPDLLTLIDVQAAMTKTGEESRNASEVITRWSDVRHPLRAAAILQEKEMDLNHSPKASPWTTLRQALRKKKRKDLLVLLRDPEGGDTNQARSEREQHLNSILEKVEQLRDQWILMDHLGIASASEVKNALEEAAALTEEEKIQEVGAEPRLVKEWTERLSEHARTSSEYARSCLHRRIFSELNGECREEGLRLLENQLYTEALELLDVPQKADSVQSWRQTFWNHDAHRQFASPGGWLSNHAKDDELVDRWLQGLTGSDQPLRTKFAELVGALGNTDDFKRERNKGRPLVPGKNAPHEFQIDKDDILKMLKERKLQPSFIPLLGSFTHLNIISPKVNAVHQDLITQTVGLVSKYPGDLCVVLVPRISSDRKKDLLRRLRKNHLAAVIDDRDFCRLWWRYELQREKVASNEQMVTEAIPILGLLEIVCEQLDWSQYDPFQLAQKELLCLETFVGRNRDANKLWLENYTCLFAGRQLGKSALLSYLAHVVDGSIRPDTKEAQKVLLIRQGPADEMPMVLAILEAAEKKGLNPKKFPTDAMPSQVLRLFVQDFQEKHPEDHLLIAIDEADRFVETQLKEYETRHEDCLSFHMRSISDNTRIDGGSIPRVRFLLSGYRVTDTTKGTWTNWGQPHFLPTLDREDATELVGRPLARCGVDASAQARVIAFRCGDHPAVLLPFGKQLIKLAQDKRLASPDGHLKILQQDVVSVFNDSEVQGNIQRVVHANFQGNPLGQAIFSAALLELYDQPPGQGLNDAAEQIHCRLREAYDDLSWLGEDLGAQKDVISDQLTSFVNRRLLVVRSPKEDETTYFLKYPHHLQVLLAEDQGEKIRKAIQELQRLDATDSEEGVLSRQKVKELKEALSLTPDSDLPAHGCGVGTLWTEAAQHVHDGILNQLDFHPSNVVTSKKLRNSGKELSPTLALCDANPEDLNWLLEQRRGKALPAPLVLGGVDLLRWFVQQSHESDDYFYFSTMGRWKTEQVRWWFNQVRGLEMPEEDVYKQIRAITSGIPLLLRLMDHQLVPNPKAIARNLSNNEWSSALSRYKDSLSMEVRRLLVEDPESTRLEPREVELFQVITLVSKASGQTGSKLGKALTEEWDQYREHCPDVEKIDEAKDAVALEVLVQLGLVTMHQSGIGILNRLQRLPSGDAAFQIAEALTPAK